jgi:hypothetical protein
VENELFRQTVGKIDNAYILLVKVVPMVLGKMDLAAKDE